MGNSNLADKIHSNYILPFINQVSTNKEENAQHPNAPPSANMASNHAVSQQRTIMIKDDKVEEVGGEFRSLSERFAFLSSKIKRSFKASSVETEVLQDLIEDLCGLAPLPQGQATFEAVFRRLKQHCSILNFRVLILLVENLLSGEQVLQKELAKFNAAVENFKKSAKMIELVSLIKANQQVGSDGDHEKVELKVRDFWSHFTMQQFEKVMNEILYTLYDRMSHITVGKGCICISWVIPNHINARKLVPESSLEFVQVIGIISLRIGDNVIYSAGEGCETIEAAMLQAIELKNTRAIELLLAVGCSPEVATYNEDTTVTSIVNISQKSSDNSGGCIKDHVCILGHSEKFEAIVDPSSSSMKDKMIKQLHQQIDSLQQTIKKFSLENSVIQMTQDAECKKLSEQLRSKEEEVNQMKIEIFKLRDREKIVSESTAALPHQRLGIGEEMKVKVIARSSKGKDVRSAVKAILWSGEECPVSDNGDGTYLVSVIPQQLGQHQLSITVDGEYIQDSPFTLNVVPQRNYNKLDKNFAIALSYRPNYIAFSDRGDMFVTTSDNHCVHVYDKSGNETTIIGSRGKNQLQFESPYGIDINGDVVFVAEQGGNRIHMLKTKGEFIGTFGRRGSGVGEFNRPHDVKISPDGKVYVADSFNDRVQVFNRDWTISHIVNAGWVPRLSKPKSIAFDLSGDVHVTAYDSSSVSVFSPTGNFVRRYSNESNSYYSSPVGISIDPSGHYSLVTADGQMVDTLSVYDHNGRFMHSIEGFNYPCGVSISSNGSIWVADTGNRRLLVF